MGTTRANGFQRSAFAAKGLPDERMRDLDGNLLPMQVAMVAECVRHNRKYMRPLKSIYLCPSYYGKFVDWVRTKCTEQQADYNSQKLLTFDGVEIYEMLPTHIIKSKMGNSTFDFDYYETKQAEA